VLARIPQHFRLSAARLVLIAWGVLPSSASLGHDWPQFLGPTRDGVYRGNIRSTWGKEAPKPLWRKTVGAGFSAPVVAGDRVLLFDRSDDNERLTCYQAQSGAHLWTSRYPATYRDDFGFSNGPRATPSVSAGKVFSAGAAGVLTAWDLLTGKKIWRVDTRAEFKPKKGFFGAASSPLVEKDRVLVNVGGAAGAGIVAFDAASGSVVWKATDHQASYSSPTSATIAGERHLFFLTRSGLVDLTPEGKVRFEFPFRARIQAAVNAATPLVHEDQVFLSASYRTGAVVLNVKSNPPTTTWSSSEVLSNHYATSVYKDRYFYGFDGRQEHGPALSAVRAKDGHLAWKKEGLGAGTLLLVGDHLLIVGEQGRVILARAHAEAFEEVASAKVLGGTIRAHSALAHGLLFLRNGDTLLCVDLRSGEEKDS
jgi:outer membrane protein assembly factor BamB